MFPLFEFCFPSLFHSPFFYSLRCPTRAFLKARANGCNIIGRYMLRPFAHPVVCCWMLLHVVAQTFKTTTPNISLICSELFRNRRSVAQQCWIRLHSSSKQGWGHARLLRMVYKDLWVVSFSQCTVGPNIVESCCHTTANTHTTTPNIVGATMLGAVASVCTQPNTLIRTADKNESESERASG